MRKILCLDFDGVVHSYASGWHGADRIDDPPVEGALEFIVAASVRFEVVIHSSRCHQAGGIEAIRLWLWKHAFASGVGTCGFWATLRIEATKPPAHLTLDDRAVTFCGTWPDLDDIERFRPWNRK